MSRFNVRQVAVLGAGVMGSQIAAHLANVGVGVVLFELPASQGPRNANVVRAIDNLRKQKPAPLAMPDAAALIRPANYDDDLPLLSECQLVIEAIAERMDWKLELYERIAGHIAPEAVVASNTSGLSVSALAEALPEPIRPRFCGIHFFNPPRWMKLVELIPTTHTRPDIIDQLESFVTTALGKGVVRAMDTPNFVANRVGVANLLATIHEAERFGLTADVVDDLTGSKLGRASSGTFRTGDVVGLDTLAHVIGTMQEQLPEDPFHASYRTPAVLAQLIDAKAFGQKSGAGFFKKVGRDILRFDLSTGEYVPAAAKADPEIVAILKLPAAERLKSLRASTHPQGRFLWAVLRDGFHYAAVQLADIAESARDIDLAMRWGFGMRQGPFELWQAAGWLQVAEWVREDIAAGDALSHAPLPDWVFEGPVADGGGVHRPEGSWSPSQGAFVAPSALPVYRRQLLRESVTGGAAASPETVGRIVKDGKALRLWTMPGSHENILIASIKTKGHTISGDVIDGLAEAVALAEASHDALVIWQDSEPFSFGADLESMAPAFMAGGQDAVEPLQKRLQALMLNLRHALVPTVAAVRGMALGGGCELALHASRRVAAMESYFGLVEIGVGLIPGGGGLAYIARRAAEMAGAAKANADLVSFLKEGFTAAAMATVGSSALHSRQLGYLLDSDVIVPNPDELLFVALTQARAMADSAYRPPPRAMFRVAGRAGAATIRAQLLNMREGGFISAHDEHVASRIAEVLCGGDVDAGSLVDEAYIMALERRHFNALLAHPKTQERIMGFLRTGKPTRN